jgi:Protein of unknown function (DUF4236)
MGLRFNRRVSIFPGFRLNFGKTGVSASVGRRGAWLTFGRRRTRATVGLPGTGLSYTTILGKGNQSGGAATPRTASGRRWVMIMLFIAAMLLSVFLHRH